MKLIHLSDLHLGKRVSEFSMLEDQKHILSEIMDIIEKERPDGMLIAGDIYDKGVPPAEAVHLFDEFLFRLSKRGLQVFIISGNHDSPERIAFGSRLMIPSGIHLSPVYDGAVSPCGFTMNSGRSTFICSPFSAPLRCAAFSRKRKSKRIRTPSKSQFQICRSIPRRGKFS